MFVYGTLMRGEARHELLSAHGPRSIEPARVVGRLIELGGYPGLVDLQVGEAEVEGEVAAFDEVGPLLEALDRYEDYRGPGVAGSLYHRVMVEVTTDSSPREPRMAWTYVYARDPNGAPTIAGGDWRAIKRRGGSGRSSCAG